MTNLHDDEKGEMTKTKWNAKKPTALKFWKWLLDRIESGSINDNIVSIERDRVHALFEEFLSEQEAEEIKALLTTMNLKKQRLEATIMTVLREQKLMKSQRYNDGVVICSFADRNKKFAPREERKTVRDKLRQHREALKENKRGIVVSENPAFGDPYTGSSLPINETVPLIYRIYCEDPPRKGISMQLKDVRIGGSHKKSFQVATKLPLTIVARKDSLLQLEIRATRRGVYRSNVFLYFTIKSKGGKTETSENILILRTILLRGGDSAMYDVLKPTSPYAKKQRPRHEEKISKENTLGPPPNTGGSFKYKGLKSFQVPFDLRKLVESGEMENGKLIVPPTEENMTKSGMFPDLYKTFWQNMTWISELQAYRDVQLFDMENVAFEKSGRLFKLFVAGLAEGRPSVLRGDLVDCTWKGKKYRGRVVRIELLNVLLEFHKSFEKNFKPNIDRVNLVRFTITRTQFRTAHEGCLQAPKTMGMPMLLPNRKHVSDIEAKQNSRMQRTVPGSLKWASRSLNEEQKACVTRILKGNLRPMPYCIFGPPGTGKTTTIVEAVYHLARLHKYNKNQGQLRILLVAPSNDASDILVEKLAPYFPPSEMIRVLAFTRNINEVSPTVRTYVREGVAPEQVIPEIKSKQIQIVVSTINLAARFWCMGDGIQAGYFDVLCVDEAGHATEPEVMGVAATLFNFTSKKNPNQLVLAGDPRQLGPIITSKICKKFGMERSYMERLITTSPAYLPEKESDEYPPGLVTLLVQNYRSHPNILKLPNEMFYDNKLIPSGEKMSTHSMCTWEHLPRKGFPIIFHAVEGTNEREGSSPSWFNADEVIEVVQYVTLLVKESKPGIKQEDIGVITPYARQVQKIQLGLKLEGFGDVKVGSVETFQGQERRCIIISTVRTENDLLEFDRKYNLGFVANEKRFNVAVTRAKALLIIVGNPRVLETDQKNWLPLLRYCNDHGAIVGAEWKEGDAMESDDELSHAGVAIEDLEAEEDPWQVVTAQEAQGFINREE